MTDDDEPKLAAGEASDVSPPADDGDPGSPWDTSLIPLPEIDLSGALPCEFNAPEVHIHLAEGVILRGGYTAVQRMGEQLVEHLTERGGYGDSPTTIDAQIVKVVNTLEAPVNVELRVEGKLQGEPYTLTTRARRRQKRAWYTSVGDGLIYLILYRCTRTRRIPLQLCLDQCAADICLQLDRKAGQPEGPLARVYRAILALRWPGAVAMGAYCFWRVYQARDEDVWTAASTAALISGLAMYYLIEAILGLLTPRRFFEATPLGKRESARLNIENAAAHRLRSLLGLVLCCVSIAAMLSLAR